MTGNIFTKTMEILFIMLIIFLVGLLVVPFILPFILSFVTFEALILLGAFVVFIFGLLMWAFIFS